MLYKSFVNDTLHSLSNVRKSLIKRYLVGRKPNNQVSENTIFSFGTSVVFSNLKSNSLWIVWIHPSYTKSYSLSYKI
ncbi:hypothetical protein AB3N60_12390 [Leptospira sp. WS39.C2]